MKIVPDNYTYACMARFIKDRMTLDEDKLEGLEEIVMDAAKAKMILDAARSSMGEHTGIAIVVNFLIVYNVVILCLSYIC